MTAGDIVRPTIAALKPYVPGTTVDQARRKYNLTRIVKLSSNENPWGSSPRALEALRSLDALNIYVDDSYPQLRERFAARHGVPFEGVVLGHGSNEILWQLFGTFVDSGEEVVMANPSFSLYRNYAMTAGATPVEIPLRDGVHDLPAMSAAVTARTKMVIVCDPNNPTATQVERADFDAFVQSLPPRVLLVLDQAYIEYASGGVDGTAYLADRPNTIVLRTASKVWGLAALRFGYGLTSPSVASYLERTHLPFNVSLPALTAVAAALDDDAFIAKSVQSNASERARVIAACERLQFTAFPSAANFIAIAVPTTATVAYEALLRRGVIVRSGDGLRMPGRLRVTIGTPEENDLFLAALGEYAAGARDGEPAA